MNQNHDEAFLFRPAAIDDAEVIADLLNACALVQGGMSSVSKQSILESLQIPGLDLEKDTMLALNQEGQAVGSVIVQENSPNAQLFASMEVHPQYKDQDVGTFLVQWIEERAHLAAGNLSEGDRIAVLQKRLSTDDLLKELLIKQGYHIVRYNFLMTIEMVESPPAPAVVEGIIIRPFIRDKEMRALIQTVCDALRDNWGYVDRPFDLECQRWVHLLDSDAEDAARYWFVAVHDDEIVGFSICQLGKSQDSLDAEILVVGVKPAWRRRGIALALLQHSFYQLYQRGKRKIVLQVDAENQTGATRLYEKAGMRVRSRYDFFEKIINSGNT